MNSAQTVFVVGEKSEIWWAPAFLTVFLLVGVYFLLRYGRRGGIPFLMGSVFAIIGLLGPVIATSMWYKLHRDTEALRSSRAEVVTGKVTNFRLMPKQGHSLESFQVGKAFFSYSDYDVTRCFNRTASHGGPIRDGLEVRISYTGNCILKLEVLQSP